MSDAQVGYMVEMQRPGDEVGVQRRTSAPGVCACGLEDRARTTLVRRWTWRRAIAAKSLFHLRSLRHRPRPLHSGTDATLASPRLGSLRLTHRARVSRPAQDWH